MSLEPTIRKSVEQGIFRFLANETLAKGVLELYERVRRLEDGCPDAKQQDLGPGPIQDAPPEDPLFFVNLPSPMPGFTETLNFYASTLARMVAMEKEGKIQGRMAQEILHLQDELHKSHTREQKKIQELEEAKHQIATLEVRLKDMTENRDEFFKRASERLDEIAAYRNRNEDLMKRLDAALASIQDVHSILGTEIANEGIRLAAMRIKEERDEALQELANIDAVLGNREALASCKTRAAKVEMMVFYCQKFAAMK